MSALCQKRTHALQQKVYSFDHLIGAYHELALYLLRGNAVHR
jgi:hypothetical protein